MAYPGTERTPVFAAAPGPDIAANLAALRTAIAKAARAASREPAAVELLAVSKTQAAPALAAALEAGQRAFGENRVQEAQAKWPAFRDNFPDLRLHLIGPLQTNKVKEAVHLFDVIETVDREKLACAIAAEVARSGKPVTCFIQVNTGEESQKAGVVPREADAFIRLCRDELKLDVTGLMCIPPQDEEPAFHFALLREIAKRHGISRLSMGMSHDFETAIAFGATEVRVGTAVFGQRATPAA
jgi:pyridoxal phosphate enzyme (YggS family)